MFWVPFSSAVCFSASDIKKSWIILRSRPFPSSSGEAKIWSMIEAERSIVISVGWARKRKPKRMWEKSWWLSTIKAITNLDTAKHGHGGWSCQTSRTTSAKWCRCIHLWILERSCPDPQPDLHILSYTCSWDVFKTLTLLFFPKIVEIAVLRKKCHNEDQHHKSPYFVLP